ncbi:tRNA lysidine(34) synthetase TilS [Chitinibacteraceae bacterium HSL-7]
MASSAKSNSTDLAARVRATWPQGVTRVCVALSGGVDSVVLLHLMTGLREQLGFSLCACHVHHGLSPNADAWAEWVQALCAGWQVPLTVARVVLEPNGLGVEAAARAARYEALSRCDADVIALAHHRDDQAETVLLNLLRGSGVAGLAAMPIWRQPESGPPLWRPLLGEPRAALLEHASQHDLTWVEDESNTSPAFRRNVLRHQVMPVLSGACGTDVGQALARSARLLAQAHSVLEEVARADVAACSVANHGFDARQARKLGEARSAHALRAWLADFDVNPDERALDELQRQARAQEGAEWRWRAQTFAVFRGVLYRKQPQHCGADERVVVGEPAVLPGWTGRLEWQRGGGLRAGDVLTLRARQGGERLRTHAGTRPLKLLFQEAAIAPWLRDAWPLLYQGGELVAVPGVAVARSGWHADGLSPVWEPAGTGSPY